MRSFRSFRRSLPSSMRFIMSSRGMLHGSLTLTESTLFFAMVMRLAAALLLASLDVDAASLSRRALGESFSITISIGELDDEEDDAAALEEDELAMGKLQVSFLEMARTLLNLS